jgi:hypothetical protein
VPIESPTTTAPAAAPSFTATARPFQLDFQVSTSSVGPSIVVQAVASSARVATSEDQRQQDADYLDELIRTRIVYVNPHDVVVLSASAVTGR